MDTNKLKQILEDKIERENAVALQKALADNKRRAELERKAQDYLPKIAEWIDNANVLLDAGIELYSHNECFCCNRDYKRAFCTDGCRHDFGFYPIRGNNTRYTEMGIMMGGADGDRDIHSDGTDWWIEEHGRRKEMTLSDFEKIFDTYRYKTMNKVENFEINFNNFLENL